MNDADIETYARNALSNLTVKATLTTVVSHRSPVPIESVRLGNPSTNAMAASSIHGVNEPLFTFDQILPLLKSVRDHTSKSMVGKVKAMGQDTLNEGNFAIAATLFSVSQKIGEVS